MKISEKTCVEFVNLLASKSAVPGGGGAAALVGAIGMALGSMVCNLTIAKKKYAEYEDSVKEILVKAGEIEEKLLSMIDEDANNFLPLSKAYGLPTSTEEEKKIKEETMENALKVACEAPINIVRMCFDAIKLHEDLVDKGSRLIKDMEYVEKVRNEVNHLVEEGVKICDEVYAKVEKALGK